MKILAVFTGGTIGSKSANNSINVDSSTSYELISQYNALADKKEVEFDFEQPLSILSENLVPGDWQILYKTVMKKNPGRYDGIIITHGSDTLAYSSAALGYLFAGLRLPVVLVAAAKPLGHPLSNGLLNFKDAVDFIASGAVRGVFVVFDGVVHLGTRLTEATPFNHKFQSAGAVPFGNMSSGNFTYNNHPMNPSLEAVNSYRAGIGEAAFCDQILVIKPYPGLDYRYLYFVGQKPKAILHMLYHSGTACMRDIDRSLVEYIKYCSGENVPLYIAPIQNCNGEMYETSHGLIGAGAIIVRDIAFEAALVKLMLCYGASENIPEEFLSKDLFFEHICVQS